MPSIVVPAQTIAITAVTAVTLTCTSTARLFPNLVGTMVDSTGANSTIVIVKEIVSATTFICKFRTIPAGRAMTDYNGGNIYFENQVVSATALYNTTPSIVV